MNIRSPRTSLHRLGFTLVELLIVVAIIAILASIAIPNFLEAQVRAKVSRSQADMRSIATGIESYRVDWNAYPPTPFDELDEPDSRYIRLRPLTTPTAYLTSIPLEIFALKGEEQPFAYWSDLLNDDLKSSPVYFYLPEEQSMAGRWALFSRGPDLDYEAAPEESMSGLLQWYDPTNGTVSDGDLMRFGP